MNRVIWCDSGWMPFNYGFCPSEKAWLHALKQLGVTVEQASPYLRSGGRCTTFETANGDLNVIITLHESVDSCDPLVIMALLAHECVHAWQGLKKNIGETEPSPEFEAYSIQMMLFEIATAYFKTRNPNRFLPLQKSSVPEASRAASAKK